MEDCERNESRSIESICLWFCLLKVLPVNQWLSAAYLAGTRRLPSTSLPDLSASSPPKKGGKKERQKEKTKAERINQTYVQHVRRTQLLANKVSINQLVRKQFFSLALNFVHLL